MHERLATIRAKLDRLRAVDRHHRVFGARKEGDYGHAYAELPVLDAAGIAMLEREHGTSLPTEVRAFLETVHGGGPGPGYGFDLWGERRKSTAPFPFTLADFTTLVERQGQERAPSLSYPDAAGDDDDPESVWPPGRGFLALAHRGCGAYDILVVNGELRGSVWCYDMALRPYVTNGRPSSFLDWYEGWLDDHLEPTALRRLQAP